MPAVAITAKAQAQNVEKLAITPISQQDARTLNDKTPFAFLGPDLPTPFVMSAQEPDYTRALDCLASAAFYEAGNDRNGQAAVAQVVLNRMHHPAFPHSICNVVYQGAGQAIGCQFSFTCDGALRRKPTSALWHNARQTASAFLAGETYPGVGMATHYHTDWVHPYWSASLEKIARVGPHLFFRWSGNWGRRSAFSAIYIGTEAIQPKLAFLSSAHQEPQIDGKAMPIPGRSPDARITETREGDHFILIESGGDGGSLAIRSLSECQEHSYCKVIGWDRESAGYGSPQDPVIRTVAFLYVRDKRTGVEMVLWDCARFVRPAEAQCLSKSNRRWITFQGDLSRAS